METQLVAVRAQLLSSCHKINHALHEFIKVLCRDVLRAQIPRNWYELLYSEQLCKKDSTITIRTIQTIITIVSQPTRLHHKTNKVKAY